MAVGQFPSDGAGIQQLLQLLLQNGDAVDPASNGMLLGGSPSFSAFEDGSLQGILGGLGREGGGAIGAGFGALFGDQSGNVNLGGGNTFQPGQGFQQAAQGPSLPGQGGPTAQGFDMQSFLGSLFGGR